MSAPQPTHPQLYAYQRTVLAFVAGRRFGKTHALAQAMQRMGQAAQDTTRALQGLRPTLIIHDEFYRCTLIEPCERPDRSHFERGGRYRKPPASTHAVAKEPGMVQVRGRDGSLTWKKLGNGMATATETARMRSSDLWGRF